MGKKKKSKNKQAHQKKKEEVIPKRIKNRPVVRAIYGEEADPELRKFTIGIYQKILALNSERKTFQRDKFHRRLDALARLIVGDEVCSAVAFDGQHLLITSNLVKHKDDCVQAKIDLIVEKDSSFQQGVVMRSQINLNIKDNYVSRYLRIPSGKIFYQLNAEKTRLVPSREKIEVKLPQYIHGLEGLSELSFEATLSELNALSDSELYQAMLKNHQGKRPADYLDLKVNYELIHSSLTPISKIDPLKNRVEKVIDHLATIVFISKAQEEKSDEQVKKAKEHIRKYRLRFLKNSLSWEASKWYKESENLRKHKDNQTHRFKERFDEMLVMIYDHFNAFIRQKNISGISHSVVKEWEGQVNQEIFSGKIFIPSFVTKSKVLIKRCCRYFLDIYKLEEFIIEDFHNQDELSSLLQQERRMEEKKLPIVIDNLEDGLHAEMRLLNYLREKGKTGLYIATSKLCCAHCYFVLNGLGEKSISGIHGKMFDNWVLSQNFHNDGDLKKIFGVDLFPLYEKFKSEKILLADGRGLTKGQVVLEILQSLSVLEPEDISVERKIWCDGEDLADESDDESNDMHSCHHITVETDFSHEEPKNTQASTNPAYRIS